MHCPPRIKPLCLILCLVLSGCYFSSAAPLFPEARGQCPFTNETVFREQRADQSDKYSDRLTFRPDGPYCAISSARGDREGWRSLFVPFGPGRWIVQTTRKGAANYFIAERLDDELHFLFPDCRDFGAADLTGAGVKTTDTTCRASNAEGLERLFRAWRAPADRTASLYRRVTGAQR